MVRPFVVLENPTFPPYVCIQCGVGHGRREWFVDLGLALDHYFNTDNAAVYLCNECYFDMVSEVGKLVQKFRKDHEKWNTEEEPSYDWIEKQDDERGRNSDQLISTTSGSEGATEEPTGVDSSSNGNDQDTEPNNSEPEPTDSGDANSTDDSSSDGSGEPKLSITFGES